MGNFPWLCQISIGYIGISWYIPIKSLWLTMNSHFFMSLGTSTRNSSKDFSHCCPLPQALIMADCRITSGERSAPAAGFSHGFSHIFPSWLRSSGRVAYIDNIDEQKTSFSRWWKKSFSATFCCAFDQLYHQFRQFRVGTWNCSESVKHPSYSNYIWVVGGRLQTVNLCNH